MTSQPLNYKVAVVTGGGRGLGRAMTLALAGAGAKVVVTAARQWDEIETVAADAGEDRVEPVLADVTRSEDCERVVKTALTRFGGLHVLVNNAGLGMKYVSEDFLDRPTRFWETAAETWRMIVDTNVNGPFHMARAALPTLLPQRWGRIINISMNRSTMGRRGFSPYGPSKAALESETVIWARDLAGTGVTVNALLPGGATATGMIPEGASRKVKDTLLSPEIIVPPLLWLASDASENITGQRFDASRWRGRQALAWNIANAGSPAGCLDGTE